MRLIALTGYGQKAGRELALRAGFDEHLVKPVKFEHLAQLKSEADAAQQPAVQVD